MIAWRGTSSKSAAVRRGVGLALGLALMLSCCTTYMAPVVCGETARACGDRHDVTFCESVVMATEGRDCAGAGLSVGKTFCYVTAGRCVSTTYALFGQDCVVRDFRPVSESAECSPGTPTFGF